MATTRCRATLRLATRRRARSPPTGLVGGCSRSLCAVRARARQVIALVRSSCAARPPRHSRSCSPLIAARSARSRLIATPPCPTARRRARSPPTGLVSGCSHSLCSARSTAVRPHVNESLFRSQLVCGSTAAPLPHTLAADRSSLCAIAACCRAAAPDRAAAGSLAADRPGRRLLALIVLCAQHRCARPRAASRCSEAGSCAARPTRRSHSRSPLIAAHSAQSRLAATPPRLTARWRARSPPTGLVGGCSRSLCSARSTVVRARVPRVDALKRSSCAARPPRRSRSRSPLIAAHSARSRLTAALPRLTARQRARSPPTGLVGGRSRSLCSARSTAVRSIVQRVVVLVRGSCAARSPRRSRSCPVLIAARSARSRLAAAPPRLTMRWRACSAPTDLVDGCSRSLCSARSTAVRVRARRVAILVRGSCAARPPRHSRSRSPLIAAHSARLWLAAAPPRLTARRRARSPPTGLVGGCSRSLCSMRSTAVRSSMRQVVVLTPALRGSTAAPLPLLLAAEPSSFCAIAARCSAAAPDRAAASSLATDRPGRWLLALVALCAQNCRARPRAKSHCSRARLVCSSAAAPLPLPLAADRSQLTLRDRSSLPCRHA